MYLYFPDTPRTFHLSARNLTKSHPVSCLYPCHCINSLSAFLSIWNLNWKLTIMEYCELILCTISNSANFNHHRFNRHVHISLICHSICDFVNNLFHTKFTAKNIACSASVVAGHVSFTVIKGKRADLDLRGNLHS